MVALAPVTQFPTGYTYHQLTHDLKVPPKVIHEAIGEMPEREAATLYYDWRFWARPKQTPPTRDYRVWMLKGGRGSGKTWVGSNVTNERAKTAKRIALVGRTAADVRDVMVEGEALWVGTPIATPSGWTDLGELEVGDEVFARDGSVTKIVAVSPTWNDRPCYMVWADGAFPIIADANHKWVTSDKTERRPDLKTRRESVKTTQDVKNTLYRRYDMPEHEIPMNQALDLPDKNLEVAPYTLGVWLGDGDTRGHGAITCHPNDAATITGIINDGYEVTNCSGKYEWYVQKLARDLKRCGVVADKHIPLHYLRASFAQRLALLQGLMDSDGYVSERGQCAFDNTNESLVEDVRELMLTVGLKPGMITKKLRANRSILGQVPKRPHKNIYRITFTVGRGQPIPFRLARKVARCIATTRPLGRLVREVERCESVPVRCIQVAHESGTYLAGHDMVVTHNSGLIATAPPWFKPKYEAAKRRVVWPNGCVALCFTADEPNLLRGPQFEFAWADELAAWRKLKEAWDNLMFGLRLGNNPQCVVTTTPRPLEVIKKILAQATTHVSTESTYNNAINLAKQWAEEIISIYEGTRLGRQELAGEILDDNPNALWTRECIDKYRLAKHGRLDAVVVAVDPPSSDNPDENSAEAGIVVGGRKGQKTDIKSEGFVLDDMSMQGKPEQWGMQAVSAYHKYTADKIVAEANNGGSMVRATIQAIDPNIPVELVYASRGKATRAEPVSTLYERGRVHHIGHFPELEDQQCEWEPGANDKVMRKDRLDANVWLWTDLLLGDMPKQTDMDMAAT